jgi:hypothetical protein
MTIFVMYNDNRYLNGVKRYSLSLLKIVTYAMMAK